MATNRDIIVSLVQFSADDDDRSINVGKVLQYLNIAGDRGSKVVVLPELWTGTGASRAGRHREIADTIPGDICHAVGEKAREYGMFVIGSMFEASGDTVFNTAPVIGPDGGIVTKYRKTHLFNGAKRIDLPSPKSESDIVSPGDALTLVDAGFCKFGVAICADLRFPEIFRHYALAGAEVVVIPTAFLAPRVDHWDFLTRARACDNQMFILATGMVGKERHSGTGYVGRSSVVDPWGVVQNCSNDREGCLTTTIDLDFVREVRSWWSLNEERRPDLYNI
ncbi:carbon-nitrogen hydrolase family protein [Sinorhizobium meliloti]|uniref:carbon-nitrogen hydrolase family protein n=1 Tax=Rhizobium meliloti TaxID=382 RepID=UPI00398D0CC4